MSQNTLVKSIGDLATAVGNNQKLLAAATAAANSTAIAAGEAASEALAKAEQAMTAGGGASGTDTYSTDGTDTGKTWVDGKTIYRRVFITQTKATLNTANTIANLASVEIGDVVRLDALITTNNGTTFLLPYWSNTAGVNVGIYGNGDTLREAHTHDEYSNCPLKIILEYTKASA